MSAYPASYLRCVVFVAPLCIAATAHAEFATLALDQQATTQVPGATRMGEPTKGVSATTDWSVALAQGSCYLVSAISSATVHRISISLWAPDGRRVAEEKPRPRAVHLRHCAAFSGVYHAQAKVEGTGPYLAATYAMPTSLPTSKAPALVALPSPPAAYPPPPYAQTRPYPVAPYVPPAYGAPQPYPVYVAPQYPTYVQPSTVVVQPAPRTVIVPVFGGKACNSSIDCGPGEFCKADTDGVQMCMGSGHSGMSCSSSIDCGPGLFCKDRGDDYMTCM